jgi:membrane fusion protein (multidrug efflux system)
VTVVASGAGLAAWKYESLQESAAASSNQPEPMESVVVAVAREIEHRQTTTSIGTVLALRSITLKNELPGTVRDVRLVPGQVVDAGAGRGARDGAVAEAALSSRSRCFTAGTI